MPLPLLGAAAAAPWLQGLLGLGAGFGGWKIGEQIAPWLTPQRQRGAPIAQVSPEAWETLAGLTPEERAGLPFPIAEEPMISQILRRRRAEEEVKDIDITPEVPPQPTEPPPEGFEWRFDRDLNRWVPQFVGLTAQQRAQQELAQQQLAFQRQQALPQPVTPYQQEQLELQRQRLEFEMRPPTVTPYQEQQFGLQEQQLAQQRAQQQAQFGLQEQQFAAQQQQFQQQLAFQQTQAQAAQEEQERQYMSQLAAQPINWLQYAAYTGQEPVVQPWMQPLGFQGGAVTPQAGQPLPGFQGQVGQQGIQTFAGLPQLRTPSAQLQARWGPTAQAQYLGYRQARTGAAPEETQFRLGAGRAPTGAFGGFSRFR